MGIIYLCFMLFGALIVRVPAPGWKPAGYVPPAQPKKLITDRERHRRPRAADAAVLVPLGACSAST